MFDNFRRKLSKVAPLPEQTMKTDARAQGICSPPPATRRPAPETRPPSESPPAYEGPAPVPYCKAPDRCLRTTPAADWPPSAAPTQIMSQSLTPTSQTADDTYGFLSTFDTILLIDDSGSMAGLLWNEARNALTAITPICTARDTDGIDIHFLNHTTSYTNITSPAVVDKVFANVRPRGGTPTGQRLNTILRQYLRTYKAKAETTKPINLICITDGAPSDDVESVLIACAKKLDKLDAPAWQVGVQFFQIGSNEQAQKHLSQLDDELRKIAGDDEMRDMIDTVPFQRDGKQLTGEGILKVVLGAVTRRLDR